MENSQINPTARTEGLLFQELGDELLVYDLDRHKAHCLNTTAALIWKQCDGGKTIAQIAHALSNGQEVPVPEETVRFALAQLRKSKLLMPGTARDAQANAISRREVIRRMGGAAAIGIPLVTSLLAPRASEASTCGTIGTSCTSNAQCCVSCNLMSGLCT